MSSTRKMRALIVDNNPAFLSIFDKLLTVKGFDVTSEITFKAGLKHLKNKSYAVIFIDIPLDRYTEKQILAFLIKNNVFKKSNVLLFSSMDLNDLELDEWKKEGLYSYLKKPVERNTIVKILNDIRAKIKHPSQVLLNTSDEPADEEDTQTSDEPADEEATPEQLEKLDQLQKQILELESRREEDTQTSDEPADEEDTQTSDEPADEEDTQTSDEPADEEDTQTSDEPADEEDTQTSDEPADEEDTQTSDEPADEEDTQTSDEPADEEDTQTSDEPADEEDTQTSDEPADEEDTQTSDEPADEEATPEQLEKLDQLQKQILELESRREEDTQTSDEPADEEATPEQLEKLDQLQKQILELEHVLYSLNQKDSSLKQSISVESEPVTNDLPFKKYNK